MDTANKDLIVRRIERGTGIPGLATILSQLAPTDLQSLLIEVYRRRAAERKPAEVLADYQSNRFVRPAVVSPLALLRWEQCAFAHLPPEVIPIELAPVCPLGTASVVATVDQNWAVPTARNTEVVSDSTNVLALECAARRRELLRTDPKSTEPVHLAASHRLVRAQHYDRPEMLAHFSAFALCSAGRDQGNLRFELAALGLHIRFYLGALRAFLGANTQLYLSATDLALDPRVELIESQLFAAVRTDFAGIDCAYDGQRKSGRGYYRDLCFHIHGETPDGQRMELADGGCVNWTQQYLSNAKERLVISGIGSERVCELESL